MVLILFSVWSALEFGGFGDSGVWKFDDLGSCCDVWVGIRQNFDGI